MTAAPGSLASLLEPRRTPTAAPSGPLWAGLARPPLRRVPLRGFDVFGERVRGMAARLTAGRGFRARAEAILAEAGRLAGLTEAGLDDAVGSAREAAVRGRDGRAAVDGAYAAMVEVVRREVGLRLHPEQVMGALAMAAGCCAEMATGEGKTVTAILPAALEAWAGRGVHVITVNDYLARRDAATTMPAYRRLGLSVGVIQDASKPPERRRAYAMSITYAADKQVIFDFLRDRLAAPLAPRLAGLLLEELSGDGAGWGSRVVQRGLHAAIVDEADSVLIDEATTPAIIGQDDEVGGGSERDSHYRIAAAIAGEMTEGEDYRVDRRLHRVVITEAGRTRLAARAEALPPFWAGPRRREELVLQALTAKALYHLGDEYIVREGKVVIVDRSTGRILEGRQWQLGLHQSVEAKEGLATSQERRTTARISYQRFFQRYARLCGMTGTAREVAEELWRHYQLPVVRIPTHRPVIRVRAADRVFRDEESKFEAVAGRVEVLHAEGRPVLIGTRSVASSERLGEQLAARGVPCRILNATREAEEAAIVAEAGRVGAVTVATNMAGRGTDILLEERTRALGGLVVIATERHDESRVDRQLFGRAGRQGDPGRAEVFVALDDVLIRRHGPRPLVWLCRRLVGSGGSLARLAFRATWGVAQWGAGRGYTAIRTEVAKGDAWIDLALHQHSR